MRVRTGIASRSARSSGVSISSATLGTRNTAGSMPDAFAAARCGRKLSLPNRSGTAPAGEQGIAFEPRSSRAGTMTKPRPLCSHRGPMSRQEMPDIVALHQRDVGRQRDHVPSARIESARRRRNGGGMSIARGLA